MVAISRKKVKIAIVSAGTNPSAVAETDYIKGEIKSYSKSGGESDMESDPHFGGDVDKDKPRSQIEVNFEVTPSLEDADRWESMAYATKTVGSTTVYVSNALPSDKAVFIQTGDATNGYMSYGFNNAKVTTLDMSHNADDNLTKTLNLKLSAETTAGVSNFMGAEVEVDSLPDWSSLTS